MAAANLLENAGAEVVLFDGNEKLDKAHVLENFTESKTPELYVGVLPEEVEKELDLVVLSPGVPVDLPLVLRLKEAGLPIWGEIELAYRCKKGDVLAITGTNGKTTTTALLGEIMKTAYPHVHVVGNIGIPYTGVVTEDTDDTVTVAEISSFQLETIDAFCPCVSAILNITPDHLNRHHTMENYIAAKLSIAKNQGPEQTCVLNYEDEVLRERAKELSAHVVFFSSLTQLEEGVYLKGDKIVYAHDGQVEDVIATDELNILGRHNHENVMAAVAISMNMGVPLEKIQKVIKEFKAVEHRIEFVTERFGVKYYNDSKGTNPDAAMQAIKAMPGPTLLIAGGYDKHSEFDEWIESFGGKVRYLVLIGQTRDKIAECAKRHGFNDIMYAEDLQEAVQVCASYANPGDNVLLSPACASWGQFKNFEERGRKFKEFVRNL